MIKTLTAVGNSLGLIIDKPILELLNIDKDTQLEVRTDGEGLIIRPVRSRSADAREPAPTATPAPPVPPPAPRKGAEEDEAPAASGKAPPPPAAPGSKEKTPEAGAPPPPKAPPPPPAAVAPPPPPPAAVAPPAAGPPPPAPPAPPPPPAAGPPPVAPPPPASSSSEGEKAKDKADPRERAPVSVPEVVIELRGEELHRVPLQDEAVVIGRDPGVDLHLDDRALSRKHAKVERRGAAIWIVDLGSANGTYVNGERIEEPHRMHGGDVVGVGHYRVRIEGVSEAREDTPVLTLHGPEGTHRFAMVGEQIIIGRSQSCDISIGHKSISRRHVRIAAQDGGFVVEDLGSQNPAKLNGKALSTTPTPFTVGDRLEICDFSLELGYLEDEKKAGDKDRPRTMLIDKSVVVQAAYVEGDFDQMRAGGSQGGAKKAETGEYKVDGDEAKKRSERVIRPKRKVK